MENEVLGLVAQGLNAEKITEQLNISLIDARNIIASVRKEFNVRSTIEAVGKAVEYGRISTENLVPPDFDPNRFGDLTSQEAGILIRFVETNGAESNEEIASALGIPKYVVDKSMREILYQLGAKNKIQALVYILESRRLGFILDPDYSVYIKEEKKRESGLGEEDVLALVIKGFNPLQIAEEMSVPISVVNSILSRARQARDVSDMTALVIKAIKSADLDVSLVLPGLDSRVLDRLTKTEILFLNAVLKAEKSTDEKHVADVLLVSPASVKENMKRVIEKLGAKSKAQAVAIYLEAKRKADIEKAIREGEESEKRKRAMRVNFEPITVYSSEDK